MTGQDARRLVVVGASLAGLRAVEAARKSGFTGSITLVGAEEHLPYDRPPLSKAFLDEGESALPAPFFRPEEVLRDELRVELLLGAEATGLDTSRRVVSIGDREVAFDVLVIATGAQARTLPGTEGMAGVHCVRTLDDARAVRAALEAGARTVVIGAGFIGSEVASSARKRGLEVTVVEALPTPLVRAAGPVMGTAIASLHERNGTRLLCGQAVGAIEGPGHVERVVLGDGKVLPADLVVVGIGAVPSTRWLEASGLELDNGVLCDGRLQSSVPGVYAAGDVANWLDPALGRHRRLEHWTSAAEQGAVAARNGLELGAATAYTTVPYFWSDWYGVRIQFVGSPRADEVEVVDGDVAGDRWVALYRDGDRLGGALTLTGQAEIMKYRGLISRGATWTAALEHAARRRTARSALAPA